MLRSCTMYRCLSRRLWGLGPKSVRIARLSRMTEGASLLSLPLREWTWEALDAFLALHLRENETIEYKSIFDNALPDSLVSMANGDGGHIFVGVSEANRIPDRWPLLDG